MLIRIMKSTIIIITIMNMHKKDGMQRYGSVRSLVLICCVKQKPLRPVRRGEVEVVAVRKVEFVSHLRVVLFSRANTEGDRRLASNLRGVAVLTL